jgi:hypothetical protein
MSDTKHSPSLPSATLTGDEILPIMTGPSGVLRKTTTQDIADLSGASPANATYLVQTANAGLSAERVVTDTTTIEWDFGTAGQAKANASAALIDALWTVSVSAGSEAADKIPLTVQVKDFSGNNLAGARNLFVSTLYNSSTSITYTDDGPGSIIQQNFGVSRELIFQTDSTGAAAFSVGTTGTGQMAVTFLTPQGPVVQLITFA